MPLHEDEREALAKIRMQTLVMNITLLAVCRALSETQRQDVVQYFDTLSKSLVDALPAEGAPDAFIGELEEWIAQQRDVFAKPS
jgi:hypothetical protein